MPMISPAEAAAKWARNAQSASGDYVAGAERTDKDPTALAIANQARLLSAFQDSVQSGRWAAALRAKGKQGWLEGIKTKGQANYGTGVSAAEPKVATAFGSLFPYIETVQRTVQSMPNNTDAERDNRMLTFIRGMRNYRKPS